MNDATIGFLIVLVGLFIYLIPTIVAFRRGHASRAGICILNIVAGWSGIGWLASLIWACARK
jgi:hypothetical protein